MLSIVGLQSLDDDTGLRVSEAGVRGRHQELVARPGLEAGPGSAGRRQHQRELSAVAAIVVDTCHTTLGPGHLPGMSLTKRRRLEDWERTARSRKTKPSSAAASHCTQVPSALLITATTSDKIVSNLRLCSANALGICRE